MFNQLSPRAGNSLKCAKGLSMMSGLRGNPGGASIRINPLVSQWFGRNINKNTLANFPLFALRGNEGGVPAATVFDDAALAGIIHVDQAEALAVALGPLEVVQEGPHDVALDRNTLAHNLGNVLNVRPQVVYALLVVNVVVAVPVIVEGRATLRDNQSFWGVLSVNARQYDEEAIGEDLPAHFCVRCPRDALNFFIAIGGHSVFRYGHAICAAPHEPT